MYESFADVLPPKQKAVRNSHLTTTSMPLRHLIRFKPVSGNPRSILLPVSLKDVKDIKTIKIINASSQNAARKQQFVRTHITTGSRATVQTKPILLKSIAQQDDRSSTGSSEESMLDETGEDSNSQYPRLELTGKNDHLSLVLM
jgi:cyclic AMP-responsive element-binding protein 3